MIYKDNKELAKDEFVDIMRSEVNWKEDGASLLYEFLSKSSEDIKMDPVGFDNAYQVVDVQETIVDLYYNGSEYNVLSIIEADYGLEKYRFSLDFTRSSAYHNFEDALTNYLDGETDHTRVMLTNDLLEALGCDLGELAETLDPGVFDYLVDNTTFTYDVVEDFLEDACGEAVASNDFVCITRSWG